MTHPHFRTLGRSGLVVTPLTLGTMTFGTPRWGADEASARAIFNAYVEGGGNSIDCADIYSGGQSEEMVGRFIAERQLRDRLVLATKAGFGREAGNPNAGGNGAKNIHSALHASLRRLATDYVDLFWAHAWDIVTPAEELLHTLGDLVRAGKIRTFGLSNAPAFYVAKMATLAAVRGVPGPIALQLEYSLIERNIEREHVPAAREFGMSVMPWSPLGGGFLAGKYDRAAIEARRTPPRGVGLPTMNAAEASVGGSRLDGGNPFGDSKFTARNWAILDTLRDVASEIGRPPSQVALAWTLTRPGMASTVIGAKHVEQLQDNLAALQIRFTPAQLAALDEASASEAIYPYPIFTPMVNRMVFGGVDVKGF